MVSKVYTVAFSGIEAQEILVEAQIGSGLPSFQIVGLADKAVAESKERIRACFQTMGLSFPPKRIIVNLSPADRQKEGSHYDLPIALSILGFLNIIDRIELEGFVALGELGLDGRLSKIQGVLSAALFAQNHNRGLLCPPENAPEARWSGLEKIIAAPDLMSLVRYFQGKECFSLGSEPIVAREKPASRWGDFSEVKGQFLAKRALEVAAAGGHHSALVGPPGVGKSMLARRFVGLLPPLTPEEALEVSQIHSLSGLSPSEGLVMYRPFRAPHHASSYVALVGGGQKSKPGEISLAHQGVLFLDELPEFSRLTLETLRQPLETGDVTVARANHHCTYPARFQLIAAMNPCRCGFFMDTDQRCSKSPQCAEEYQKKISGPLWDRFDIRVTMDNLKPQDLLKFKEGESSHIIAERVERARNRQYQRSQQLNAYVEGKNLEEMASLDAESRTLLEHALITLKLSARGYHRLLRVARTIADLDPDEISVGTRHIREAIQYRGYDGHPS